MIDNAIFFIQIFLLPDELPPKIQFVYYLLKVPW